MVKTFLTEKDVNGSNREKWGCRNCRDLIMLGQEKQVRGQNGGDKWNQMCSQI